MDYSKPWYQSIAIWGGLISAIAGIAGLFGVQVEPADQQTIAQYGAAGAAALGGLTAIIGRVRATKSIQPFQSPDAQS